MSAVADPVYRVLGTLEVGHDPALRSIPPGRQQVVLATLLLAANRVVSIDELVDVIWSDNPPATARTQVQICVSSLRATLAGLGPDGGPAIVTRQPGYALLVSAGQVDVLVFQRLLAEADTQVKAGHPEEASVTLRNALGLWRGNALEGISSRIIEARATQLDERRLGAIEALADLELQLGRHRRLAADLGLLVAEHPLRERLRGQLMLALYRSGRQAEALDLYRAGRELLIDQLGLEPGDELRTLQSAIFAGDASLLLDEPRPTTNRQAVRPHQLPADIADFTGREELLDEASRVLLADDDAGHRPSHVVVVIGKPGIGKSVFAVHVAHRLSDQFPDGQLYADLGGTRAEPVTAADVLGRFLRALGVPGPALPDEIDERAEVFRSLLSEKRMLVVLDDALSENQLQLLLPGTGSCGVIVTSRARLTGLPGALVLEMDVFGAGQALELLGAVIGEQRLATEPAAAAALVRLVGGLPLALRIVAARLAGRPRWTLSWMLERLADERRRLDELAHGEMMVRASLRLSYDGLGPAARRLLQLLSALDAASLPTWVAAALLDCHLLDAADLLEQLVDVQLLEIVAIDLDASPRYRFHDVIRLFAREELEHHEPPASRLEAVSRVAGGWLAMAEQAHRLVYGGDYTVLHGNAPRWQPPNGYVDQVLTDPLRWLEAERANLCAMVSQAADAGLDEACWDLAVTLVTLFESRCYVEDWEQTHQRALQAARSAGNRRGVAALMCSLGSLWLSGSRTGVEKWLRPALDAFDELGDVHGRAMAERNLALYDLIRGDTTRSMVLFLSALADFRAAGDPIGQAHVLAQLAHLEWEAGRHDEATTHLAEALQLCRGVGSRRVEAQVRYRLSGVMLQRGDHHGASEMLADLLDVVRAGHDVVGEGRILHRLGVVNARLSRWEEAAGLLAEALAIHELVRDRKGAEDVKAELAAVNRQLGLDWSVA